MIESGHSEGVGVLYAIVMDVNDLETCGKFWSQVLGTDILYQDERYLRLGHKGERPTLLLQRVPERHREKNRVHIDLDVPDLDAAVSRVQGEDTNSDNSMGTASSGWSWQTRTAMSSAWSSKNKGSSLHS